MLVQLFLLARWKIASNLFQLLFHIFMIAIMAMIHFSCWKEVIKFCPCQEQLLCGFYREAVSRNWEQEEAEDQQNDFGNTTKIT